MPTKTVTPYYTLRKGPSPDPVKRQPFPFRTMEVGHYFDVPRALDHTVRVRASEQGKKYGRQYSVRRIIERGEERTRVHRIA